MVVGWEGNRTRLLSRQPIVSGTRRFFSGLRDREVDSITWLHSKFSESDVLLKESHPALPGAFPQFGRSTPSRPRPLKPLIASRFLVTVWSTSSEIGFQLPRWKKGANSFSTAPLRAMAFSRPTCKMGIVFGTITPRGNDYRARASPAFLPYPIVYPGTLRTFFRDGIRKFPSTDPEAGSPKNIL